MIIDIDWEVGACEKNFKLEPRIMGTLIMLTDSLAGVSDLKTLSEKNGESSYLKGRSWRRNHPGSGAVWGWRGAAKAHQLVSLSWRHCQTVTGRRCVGAWRGVRSPSRPGLHWWKKERGLGACTPPHIDYGPEKATSYAGGYLSRTAPHWGIVVTYTRNICY